MPSIDEVLADELTDQQRGAAVDPARDVLALACAGSGKSRTLAYRIAWLIAGGADPASIVAFTFTNKAADSIQLRVATALDRVGIDPTVLGRLRIGTIDAFAKQVLERINADYRQFDMLDTNRLHLYLMSRYPTLKLHVLKRREGARYFECIKEVADAWVTANNEMLDLDDVAAADTELGETLDLLRRSLLDDKYVDFSLATRLVVEHLEQDTEDVERALGTLEHLLVDEYQDVNNLQERLITELRRRADTLLVAGDDDQALYGWRGADVSNILGFVDRMPGAQRHTLAHNFRSTPAIVDTAERMIQQELGANRIEKRPTADDLGGTRELRTVWFDDRPSEAEWVADRVQELLGSTYVERGGSVRGLTPADIAILMRSTRSEEQDGAPRHAQFTAALADRGIDYTLEAGGGVFDRPEVSVLVDTFELLRSGTPSRQDVKDHFTNTVQPVFDGASRDGLMDLLAGWGRRIHPAPGERVRVYPQQLLHELIEVLGIDNTTVGEGVMADIAVLSQALKDVEAVFVSVDTPQRFSAVLNFIQNMGQQGYDSISMESLRRPDAVTVATVHKVKGLEFPAVFVVDTEQGRFPGRRSNYRGWLPEDLIADALDRGAYTSTHEQEARLFYTAMTRAERYLFITGAESLPGGRKTWRFSNLVGRLQHDELDDTADALDLEPSPRRRRIDETVLPTTYSQIRYFLRCPADYRFRHVWGFNPPLTEMFGFGQTVHAAIGRLHQAFPDGAPSEEEARQVATETFHLKHVHPSRDPDNRPGAYERGSDAASGILADYVRGYGEDFQNERQVEVTFELPVEQAVIAGAIDLILRYDENNEIVDASVVDFKSMEGGPDPEHNEDLDWRDLSLQVQLYARAAREVLGENARTGSVHLLKDGERVEVPVDDNAVADAIANVEWAVKGVIAGEFPMRPSPEKCAGCDWERLCAQQTEPLDLDEPPRLQTPRGHLPVEALDE